MDELFEVLTLIQTKKIGKRIPIYLFGNDFWSKLIDFKQFVKFGVISPEDLELFQVVDEVDEAFKLIICRSFVIVSSTRCFQIRATLGYV